MCFIFYISFLNIPVEMVTGRFANVSVHQLWVIVDSCYAFVNYHAIEICIIINENLRKIYSGPSIYILVS